MKEITPEIRERIICLYYGQYVMYSRYEKNMNLVPAMPTFSKDEYALFLTPLSLISDEHAMDVCIICGRHAASEGYAKEFIQSYFERNCSTTTIYNYQYFKSIDYLRSHGYALPYLHWSVDDLVKSNVFKLKS